MNKFRNADPSCACSWQTRSLTQDVTYKMNDALKKFGIMQTNRTAIPVLVKQGGTQLFLQESSFKNIPTKSDHKMLNDLIKFLMTV